MRKKNYDIVVNVFLLKFYFLGIMLIIKYKIFIGKNL